MKKDYLDTLKAYWMAVLPLLANVSAALFNGFSYAVHYPDSGWQQSMRSGVFLFSLAVCVVLWKQLKTSAFIRPNYWIDFNLSRDRDALDDLRSLQRADRLEKILKDKGITYKSDLIWTDAKKKKDREMIGVRIGLITKNDYIRARLYA